MDDARALYLDLMKRCLTNWIYLDSEPLEVDGATFLSRPVAKVVRAIGFRLVKNGFAHPEARARGSDWPFMAHTMIGFKRLDNIQACVEDVLARGVLGDLIETGVWRGGATIFMRAILKAAGVRDRRVWVADSFQGLPAPDPVRYPRDNGLRLDRMRKLAVSIEEVRANFERYDLLDDQVRFLKGWFRDTLPGAPIERLAVMRLDGDLYESTMDALTNLYPKLSVGGWVIVDDYGAFEACRHAVADFRASQGIRDEIVPVDEVCVCWKRHD